MKLSLAWIFDHIDAAWQDQDVTALIAKFNQVTAEIEHFYQVNRDMTMFFLAIRDDADKSKRFFIPELNEYVELSDRSDLLIARAGIGQKNAVMVTKKSSMVSWTTLAEFGFDREGLLPSFSVDVEMLHGMWREHMQAHDIILEVDNKSITHRPDMWGHRGFAREIAAFLNLPFLPTSKFLKEHPVQNFSYVSQSTKDNPFVIQNDVPELCKKFNGLYISGIENKASDIFVAGRLLNVGQRPINLLVDLTNYIAFDWGQPVHVYDAEKIAGNKLVVRMAKQGETLVLLDDTVLNLTDKDMVVANDKSPMCLAGVRGGKHFSVTDFTKQVFFESGCFDAGAVRRTALRHKTRTDSSARFEKTLDPYQSNEAVLRFIALAEQYKLSMQIAVNSVSLGNNDAEKIIEISHDFLHQRAGIAFSVDEVINLLSPLGFKVILKSNSPIVYTVHVPSFRASKDIKIKEDILEELVRCYGFSKIIPNLPMIYRRPFGIVEIRRIRKLKRFLADKAGMSEVQNYSLYDEQFLDSLKLQEQSCVELINPVSEVYRRMVSSLVPSLFKNIKENHVHRDSLAIFECARVWQNIDGHVQEKKALAGIFFEKRKTVNFYDCKELIAQLFVAIELGGSSVRFEKIENPTKVYFKPNQSMAIYFENKLIGIAGKANPIFLAGLDILPTSDAFIFELDINTIISEQAQVTQFVPISRFQESSFDLSLMVPLHLTTDFLTNKLKKLSTLINKVELLDFFEKDEWEDRRSLTFRVWLSHYERTLTKSEIEDVWNNAKQMLLEYKVELRA